MTDDEGVASSVARDLSRTMDASKNHTPDPGSSAHPVLSPFGQYSTFKTKEEIVGMAVGLISDSLNKDYTTKVSLIKAFESSLT